MELAVLLSVAASFFTATSSRVPATRSAHRHGDWLRSRLVFRLARQPVWLLGFASMLAGFGLQVVALRYGPLALVQPILATELLFFFAYLAVVTAMRTGRRVQVRDWLAAVAMSGGISLFLGAAAPSGGRSHAPASPWWTAGLTIGGCVVLAVFVATRLAGGRGPASGPDLTGRQAVHRAAILGVATGIAWGFVAAVIKELSSHIGQGIGAVFENWSVYVLLATGAATMLLVSHALAAGPLAASQPGFTIGDPITAALLGVFLFDESLRTGAVALAAELAGLAILVAGVVALSHSRLITGEEHVGLQNEVDGPGHTSSGLAPRES